jgi:glyoxylase-like metal-dependent hydrolase (beta-lactamase superfamily II)
MKQIADGLYTFSGLMVGRAYLTHDADGGMTLIDTSIASAGGKILSQLAAAGLAPTQVRRIIVTHAHPDHVGALPMLKQATSAEVICSFVERPYVEGKAPVPMPPREALDFASRLLWSPPRPMPGTPVDRDVADGDVIAEPFGGLQVVFASGHTPGQIALWQPERRVLFTGDALADLPPWGLRLGFRPFTVDIQAAGQSARRLAELGPDVICFGHGQPMTENAAERLRAFAATL